ncbi:MAG: hypothetical protein AAF633_18645 [Chloroflexota bacterium]
MLKKVLTVILSGFILAGVAIIHFQTAVSSVEASCSIPALEAAVPEGGTWVRYDQTTTGVTKVYVSAGCKDQVQNGKLIGPDYRVQIYQQCGAAECRWGFQDATKNGDGWVRTTYDQGYVTRYVWIKKYQYFGREFLRVWIWHDYASSRFQDVSSDKWYVRDTGPDPYPGP